MASAAHGLGVACSLDDLRELDLDLRPRWVMWSPDTAAALVAVGVRLSTCWDIAAIHRLLHGGRRADPARTWAAAHQLATDSIPDRVAVDLFNQSSPDDLHMHLRDDGHLDPDFVAEGWYLDEGSLRQWAELGVETALAQRAALAALGPRALATARSESTAELLCVELGVDGLPLDRGAAEALIAAIIGERPTSDAHAAHIRRERDDTVLRHAETSAPVDLRNPAQVKSLLRTVGVETPDTRAWRLEALRDVHPLVDALLAWRKAERIATTYGFGWLDGQVGPGSRLRGHWTGCDGAAGRMTASNGLHNMPAQLRGAVVAEPGYVFVRADLGQIEPRVLAAVSGDRALAAATSNPDLYQPVADQLAVDRATAKVAVLGAMYGQTTGHGAQALHRLRRAYPVAMDYLDAADVAGQAGRDLRTYGGRLIRLGASTGFEGSEREARSRAAARGRYARNALVQGAAAEFFKVWAVIVRARGADLGARIVLCLHDELLVHAPIGNGDAVAQLVDDSLSEAAYRWAPDRSVRFVADIDVISRWSDAKG